MRCSLGLTPAADGKQEMIKVRRLGCKHASSKAVPFILARHVPPDETRRLLRHIGMPAKDARHMGLLGGRLPCRIDTKSAVVA